MACVVNILGVAATTGRSIVSVIVGISSRAAGISHRPYATRAPKWRRTGSRTSSTRTIKAEVAKSVPVSQSIIP